MTSHKQRHIVVRIDHGFFDIVAEESGLVLDGLLAGLRSVSVQINIHFLDDVLNIRR